LIGRVETRQGRKPSHAGSGVHGGLLVLSLLLAACGATQVTPTAISRPSDSALSCQQIESEIAKNRSEALRLTGADQTTEAGNVAKGVASAFFWPVLFTMDLSNADQIQLRALQDRNENLERLGRTRSCWNQD
jgi:hypothetical protein